jgi:T1SS-143 domain-containing protein
VTLVINGVSYGGTVAADLTYSIDVAGADLAADTTIDASVSGSDGAGNPYLGSTEHTHGVEAPPNVAPVVADSSVRVSEEGLAAANPDTTGNSDTTNSASAAGDLFVTDPDDSSFSYALTAPAAGTITSGGVAVAWTGDGTNTLVGKVGATTIITIAVDANGHYTVDLSGPVDHAAGGGENELTLLIGVTASDGVNTSAPSTLSVVIEDDSAVIGSPDTAFVRDNAGAIVEGDLHLSIGADSGLLAKVVFSGAQQDGDGYIMANRYDSSGTLVGNGYLTYNGSKLSYVANADGSLTAVDGVGTAVYTATGDAATGGYAITMLQSLDAALLSSTGSFVAVQAGNTNTYLVTDPNNYFEITATGTGGASPTVNTNNGWFGVNNNWIDSGETLSFSFASGGSATPTQMSGISIAVQSLGNGEALTWTTYDALGNVLDQGSFAGSGQGNIPDHNFTLGAADLVHGAFSAISFGGGSASTTYRMSISSVTGYSEALDQSTALNVAAVDGDGDSTAAAGLTLHFDSGGAIVGTSGNDALGGDGTANTLIGGAGDDYLLGGLGADTFKWSLGDGGAAGSPAVDRIGDFDTAAKASGGDVLDLRDLLVGESHAGTDPGTLGNFLHFTTDGSDTVVHVSTNGGFSSGYNAGAEHQSIVLEGVNLVGGLSDQQVIQNLLTNGKLVTD